MNPPTFVWTSADSRGRNEYAVFRRAFTLHSVPAKAELHLFADTRYRISVNGNIAGHGPARFKSAFPEYDTCDLAPWLQAGENVVAVLVNAHGNGTFISDPGQGGFVAWGAFADGAGQTVDMATPGAWLASDRTGHERWTLPFSFAIGPGETLDTRVLPAGWDEPGFDAAAAGWRPAVAVERQETWGPLQARSIPPLQETADRLPQNIHRLNLHRPQECVYSATFTNLPAGHRWVSVGLRLNAPVAAEVTLAVSLARLVVNGELQPGLEPVPDFHDRENSERQLATVRLRAGENQVWAVCPIRSGMVEFAIGWPVEAGLKLSGDASLAPSTGGTIEEHVATLAAAQALRPLTLEQGLQHAYLQRGWSVPAERTPVGLFPLQPAAAGQATTWVCDFAREVLGRVAIEFEAAPGTTIDLAYSERLRTDGRTHVGFQTTRMLDRCVARGGRQRWLTFHPRGFRYLEMIIHSPDTGFALHDLRLVRLRPPFAETGRFRCSDAALNQVWELCRETQVATLEDAYTDCPWRERGLYTGDQIIQYHINLALFGDHTFMRRCINLFYQTQDASGLLAPCSHALTAPRHPDYAALSVESLWHYWARSGDVAFVRERADGLERLLAGLAALSEPGGILADASGKFPYIDLSRTDRDAVSCALNCFVQGAFARGAELLEVAGRREAAAPWRKRAEALAAEIRRSFWDEEAGAFLSRRRSDMPGTTPSALSNSLALYYDIASESQRARALAYLERCAAANAVEAHPRRSTDFHISPYSAFYALEVFYRHGRDEAAERFMRGEWRRMLDGGAWACWEYFVPSHSLCHPWAAAPAWYLPAFVLGVRFAQPGDPDQLLIDPRPGTLEWAEGVLPHPRGPVHVAWRRREGRIELTHRAPEGVHVKLLQPVG